MVKALNCDVRIVWPQLSRELRARNSIELFVLPVRHCVVDNGQPSAAKDSLLMLYGCQESVFRRPGPTARTCLVLYTVTQ